jgi:hypothetical protein
VKEVSLSVPHDRQFTLTIDKDGLMSTEQGSSNLLIVRYDLYERTLLILDDPSTPSTLYTYLNEYFMPD